MRQVVKKVSRQSIVNHKQFDMLDMGIDKMEAIMGENFEEDIVLLAVSQWVLMTPRLSFYNL